MSNNESTYKTGSTEQVTLDLGDALALIAQTARVLAGLDGRRGPVDVDRGPGRRSDAARAAVARDLLRTEHLLQLAAAEVAAQYWTFKGYDDPRFEHERDGASDLGPGASSLHELRRDGRVA
jgi:hypothetical protein